MPALSYSSVVTQTPSTPPTPVRRLWREFTTIAPAAGGPLPAVQVGVAVSLPLAVVVATGHADLSAYAVFGSLTSVYGKRLRVEPRLRAQVISGVLLLTAITIGVLAGVPGDGPLASVVGMGFVSSLGYLATRRFGLLPVPSLFLVFAAGTLSSVPHTWGDLPIGLSIATVAGALGIILGRVTAAIETQEPRPDPLTTDFRSLLSAPGVRTNLVAYALAPALAAALSSAFGLGHFYWSAVAATAPLAASSSAARYARAGLRMAGTLIGILIAFGLLTLDPPPLVLVVFVAALQIATELFVARNYGIAVVFITPMALLLGYIADPTPLLPLVRDRIVGTVVGVGIAMLVLGLFHLRRSTIRSDG